MAGHPGYVFIGDDFTGASDTLATLAEGNVPTRLYLDPPTAEEVAAEGLAAVGIATDIRALAPVAAANRLNDLIFWIRALAPRYVHLKVCSTWDSAPTVGNIGAAVTLLQKALQPTLTAFVGGQPSLGRYCIFGNLFARGPDGAIHRIDRHPVMSRHPVTPMGEGDLRLHLAAQGLDGLALIDLSVIAGGAADIARSLRRLQEGGKPPLLFDAVSNGDSAAIGDALSAEPEGLQLIVGASSVAEAIGPHIQAAKGRAGRSGQSERSGPCFVLAGSRSEMTARQVTAATQFRKLAITPDDLSDDGRMSDLAGKVATMLNSGENLLAHLDPQASYAFSGAGLAERQALFAARVMGNAAIGSLGIAGGDTSSIIIRHLGFSSLAFDRRMGPGVCVCIGASGDPDRDGMPLLLKGGQVGGVDILDRFAAGA
jgi:uncharacterized protein YgbK (DUF1537 family)